MPSLSFSHVSFAWPDGRALFDHLTFTVPPGLSGLVGRNGIGKSTLIRLATGDLAPDAGHIQRPDSLAYVPQHVTLAVDLTLAQVLGVAPVIAALRAIEAGSVDPTHFDVVGEDWLVEERARLALGSLGLGHLAEGPAGLDRPVGEVSGGEAMLLAVSAALLAAPEVLLLDEPTNNLDAPARERLTEALRTRPGATLIVTHDRTVLSQVDRIGDLRERDDRTVELRWFGGALAEYEAALAVEADAAQQSLVTARAEAARQRRELTAHADAASRKAKAGAKARTERKVVGLAADARRNRAENTDAKTRKVHERRLDEAREALASAKAAIPRDRSIRVELPGTQVPARRTIATLDGLRTRTGLVVTADVAGPERIHLAGGNGSGKTTLVETVLGLIPSTGGEGVLHVPVGYLPQRMDVLDPALSVAENLRRRAPEVEAQVIRDELGRFQIRGAAADAPAGTLSGGERFRAALAAVLLSRPQPQLLILDEPTNNLDFDSQAQLVQALDGYGGALVVVSHDEAFVEQVRPTRQWLLSGNGLADLPFA